MRSLIRERITAVLSNTSGESEDAANLGVIDGAIVVTTDSFVVSPLFFPGGDIGSLAVHGTVNDLAVSGARPLYLTLSLMIEEGLSLDTLDQVIHRVARAASVCGVAVVAGDTKVVPRGAVDKLYINTAGIGKMIEPTPAGPSSIAVGDALIVSGPIGKHGIAVLAARDDLGLTPPPRSDSAPLHQATSALQSALGADLRAMRDATRGGVSAVLHEWAEACGHTMKLVDSVIPISADVRGACELLGLDPLYVANEGTFVAAVAAGSVPRALAALHCCPQSESATVVGEVIAATIAPVAIERLLGRLLAVDEPAGAPLPRIC